MKPQTIFSLFTFLFVLNVSINSQSFIINHENAFLEPIPEWAIKLASDSLHIAYGHTSHGSQITYGMKALALQSTDLKGYKGDFYCWEDYFEVYGDNPCMDIDDNFVPGDLGHNGDISWADRTRNYLLNKERAKDINVVMWSWCGGCSDNTDTGIQAYLDAMNNLENDFPDIVFIYMTGHLDHWSDAKLKHNNQLIRDYCIANNKVLFDFADIESYDPDGNYYEFSNDNCDYYNANGDNLGNWAENWQKAHEHGIDWFQCSAAHTKPLNGNRKAYAAWWMWARLIGWNPNVNEIEITEQPQNSTICDNGTAEFSINYNNADSVRWQKKSPTDTVFSFIYNDDIYTDTDLKKLKIGFDNDSLNGYFFRAFVYLNDTFAISDSALLTIDKFIEAKTQEIDEACGDTVVLKGINPFPGICNWSVLTGNSQIDTSTNFIAKATGLSFGENSFRYTVKNGLCTDTSELTVYRYGTISITKQPLDIGIKPGKDTSFVVEVDGDIEFVQWYRNDTVLADGAKYLGVNALRLEIRNIDIKDAGKYHCDVSGYCNDETSDKVLLDVLTSIQQSEINYLFTYPNPVKDILFIYYYKPIDLIEVLDLNGRIVFVSDKTDNTINTNDLSKGIYILKIKMDNSTVYKKIIKY